MTQTACFICGAPVAWRSTREGRITVDAHESMRGQSRYIEGPDGLLRPVAPTADVLAYVDHRETCPGVRQR